MMIKFFARGRGCGAGPVDYVCGPRDHSGHERKPAPEILYGVPAVIRQVIDSILYKFKYTSGVVSFAPEDNPTHAQQEEVMRDFERTAFPSLDGNQYSILWVRHEHTGRIELHFVIPRIEMTTGKAYNPAPPGWQKRYDLLRDYFNFQYGWARPDDSARARPVQPSFEKLITIDKQQKGQPANITLRGIIEEKILIHIHEGKIQNRSDIINFLRGEGFSVPRIGTQYITVINPEDNKRHRLKGLFFNEDFLASAYLQRQPPVKNIDFHKATQAQNSLGKILRQVSAYNKTRYFIEGKSYDRRTIIESGKTLQNSERSPVQGFSILEQRADRLAVQLERFDNARGYVAGSGRSIVGLATGNNIPGNAGYQSSKSQNTGGRSEHARQEMSDIRQMLINL